jgi:hypothetical protein
MKPVTTVSPLAAARRRREVGHRLFDLRCRRSDDHVKLTHYRKSCTSHSPASSPPFRKLPGYSPCLPITGDLDCRDIEAMGLAPVTVTGSDRYRLDGDGDGIGCEPY